MAVSDSSLLNEQSYKKCQEDSLSAKKMRYKSFKGKKINDDVVLFLPA